MLFNDQHERFSLVFDPRPCEPEDTVLIFRGDDVLLRIDEAETRLPVFSELNHLVEVQYIIHAFSQGTRRVFISNAAEGIDTPEGLNWEEARVFRSFASREDAFLLSTAYHLTVWYRRHIYCGACGGHTQPEPAERALICEDCGLIQYPTISPAVIVAITDGDRLLLARNAHGAFRHYSLIAGYVEVGETLEQTVRREVMEEVGLRVKDIHYLGNQPWGLSQSLMIGFNATLDGGADIVLQESELAEARWFTNDELPEHAGPSSIAFELIQKFREGKLGTPLAM